ERPLLSSSPTSTRQKSPSPECSRSARIKGMNITQLRTAFSMLDVNGDGKINAEELKHMLCELGIAADDAIVTQMIADATQNGDGLIDEEQFLRWMSKVVNHKEDDIEGDLRAAFRVFDKDNNGFITREELCSALNMMGETLTESDIDFLLNESDIDKDGRIDYEEFIRMLL
ncbi:hypothetical protein B4U79_05571, partial [Dinothrombium tinctorium]